MANAQSALKMAVCLLVIAELLLAKKDYYDILGVPKDATERQIKKAFHRLAMRYHPDKNKNPDAEVRFREIAEAYETLSDTTRRREYDQFGAGAFYFTGGRQQRPNPHQPFTFKFDDIFKDFDMYSHNNRHARRRQPFDEHSQREPHSRHRRQFQGSGVFGDVFDDIEKMFAVHRHPTHTEGVFRTTSKQHCRTVTQRRGNMVTTYTDCTAP
ncbi:dnaJ homolog subfamily B member 9a [Corythoichthys intestinalis]|uniref:dnaJ homolog subfamily B member 9a n=1 Tax=Corythoichthys intestinalis TaxID=161448 RepID=UPI0025A5FD38|nr:dnaJ homolog subfamily B member 9a [Corythoichthys intestinalis]XP_057693203.1 dnaJ homolog subfamily B member 9a [Corythoichthys intestinalis]XP_057693204.1 dnaJ homolog subfamily B member 9a [Corythoichthys intestinalis]XP_057693205.1 dnaJ homolog subfamily B member 9a [Corythoichthys intestinalis]XP_061812786.1 dnaJ homolog subfamily B member 9-like [Nerophis lumbriciformis]